MLGISLGMIGVVGFLVGDLKGKEIEEIVTDEEHG